MRRVSKGFAAVALIAVLAASNVYAAPQQGSEPSTGVKIVKIIRKVIGLDDWSWPKP